MSLVILYIYIHIYKVSDVTGKRLSPRIAQEYLYRPDYGVTVIMPPLLPVCLPYRILVYLCGVLTACALTRTPTEGNLIHTCTHTHTHAASTSIQLH